MFKEFHKEIVCRGFSTTKKSLITIIFVVLLFVFYLYFFYLIFVTIYYFKKIIKKHI